MKCESFAHAICAILLLGAGAAHAQTTDNTTSYSQYPDLSRFLPANQKYATFIQYTGSDWNGFATPTAYTPTNADVMAGYRVVGNDYPATTIVDFGAKVSNILVFGNIDHIGSGFDAYQYNIYGLNSLTAIPILLYAPLTVTPVDGTGDQHFKLLTYQTGTTAPYHVNNALTLGTGPGGDVGYEAYFKFSTPYQYYEFEPSNVPGNYGEDELTAVAQASVPEPATWLMMLIGLGFIGMYLWLRSTRPKAAQGHASQF